MNTENNVLIDCQILQLKTWTANLLTDKNSHKLHLKLTYLRVILNLYYKTTRPYSWYY